MTSDIERWGDAQQYRAEPHSNYQGPEHGVMPTVTLLSAPVDPLGNVAAMSAMYEGKVIRDLNDLSMEDRYRYWTDITATKLNTPLEAVQFEFLLEGVDRSMTHQIVRKRTGAAYAQESLRFAVPGKLAEATTLPPSLQGTTHMSPADGGWDVRGMLNEQAQGWRNEWDRALESVDAAYHALVGSGMPAEEARGLLPHATATRMFWTVNLRSLVEEAGVRLCTQAQFHWKILFAQVLSAIAEYRPPCGECGSTGMVESGVEYMGQYEMVGCQGCLWTTDQYRTIVDSGLFKPACFSAGRCPFKAGFDRDCTIRSRMDSGRAHEVKTEEWLLNPAAARRTT